jgi:L-threonylcarbamoyladenylate synthase
MKLIKESDLNSIELACDFLRAGKIISFATDTVYGIAADASNFKAVESLYEIKNRDKKNPIAIFLKDLKAAEKIFYFDEIAKKIAQETSVKGLTIILKTKVESAPILAANLNQNNDGFLGFRIIDSDFIKKLLEKFGGYLAVTSANKSGHQPAVSAAEVKKYFEKSAAIDLIIDGGPAKQGAPSTVIKIFDKKITILRQGVVKLPKQYEHFQNS